MIINNITVQDFQSYHGKHSIAFTKGLNLIIGNGGKGKSKLFNAFYWVLFGKIYITGSNWCATDEFPYSSKFAMNKHDFINKKTLSEAEESSSITASVCLDIEDDNGILYTIERSVFAKRLSGTDWDSIESWDVSSSNLKVSYDSNTGTLVRKGILADDVISKLFPDGIRNYIWFQGESLESLINFRNKDTLKAAVKHISYFPYYEKLTEIVSRSKAKITASETKKLKEVNKHNTSTKTHLLNIERLTNLIEKEEKNRDQIDSDIQTVEVALAEGDNKLKGLASFTSIVNKYKTCENEITKLNAEIETLDNYQRDILPRLWVLRGIDSMIEKSRSIIQNHTDVEDTIPELKYLDNPGKSKLEEIIRDKKCFVCGSDTSEGSEAYEYILNRIKLQEDYLREQEEYVNNLQFSKKFNMFIGKIQDYPSTLLISLSQIDKQYTKSEDRLEALMATRRVKLEDMKAYEKQIEEIKKKYGVDPIKQAETAGLVDSNIRATRSSLASLRRKADIARKSISDWTIELKQARRDYDKICNKGGGVNKVAETEWKIISIFLEDVCERVQENARKELLVRIEERANEFYVRFTEHDVGYKGRVSIGDDYSIEFDSALNTSHEDRKKMSIINALLSLNQEATGDYYPFISDAPTSSFDLETTYKYLLGIKDVFGQSIIMTKDVDLESERYQELMNETNVSSIYVLESELYNTSNEEPGLHEVATKIIQLK